MRRISRRTVRADRRLRSLAGIIPVFALALSASVAALGCATHRLAPASSSTSVLSPEEALSLAVELANEKCFEKYSRKPFERTTWAIHFEDGRWEWGGVDPHGVDGYSAAVSFDEKGKDRRVEVYFSTDMIQ
jgi:hypothetical protein